MKKQYLFIDKEECSDKHCSNFLAGPVIQSNIDGTKSASKFYPLKLATKDDDNYVRFSFQSTRDYDTCIVFEHYHGTRASNLTMTLEQIKKEIVFPAPALKANGKPKPVFDSVCVSSYTDDPYKIKDISFRFVDDKPLNDMGDLWFEIISFTTDEKSLTTTTQSSF